MIAIYLVGSAILIFVGGAAGKDAWLAVIGGLIEASILSLSFLLLVARYPGMGISKINDLVWGKYVGKLFTLAFIWYTWNLCSIVVANTQDFVRTFILNGIPDRAIDFPFGLVLILFVLSGVECIGRFSSLAFVILIGFILFVSLLALPNFDANNLRPVLATPLSTLIKSSHSLATFPFGEVVAFSAIIPFLNKRSKAVQHTYVGMIFGAVVMILITIRNVGVLGDSVRYFTYPSFSVARVINVAGFFTRMEIFIALNLVLSGGLKSVILLFASSVTLSEMLNFNIRTTAIPLGILAMVFRPDNFPSVAHNFIYAEKMYPIYAVPFEYLLPLLTLIAAVLLKRKDSSPKTAKAVGLHPRSSCEDLIE